MIFLKKSFVLFSIIGSLCSLVALAGARAAVLTPAPDQFGYEFNTLTPIEWLDLTGSTSAGLEGSDDTFSGPLQIGFDFPFYENIYSEIYINTNGLLTFGSGSQVYENRPIPRTTFPDNFIAPFWDDLQVVDDLGQVYYASGTDAYNRQYFAVEWYRVTLTSNTTDPLIFEAILYEDGDICFQYQTLQGVLDSATVGIEDGDGIVGLQYAYNQIGLADLVGDQALCFLRPAPEARVKLLPSLQSQFVQQGVANFSVTVRNTGEAGPDVFEIIPGALSGWQVAFSQADGVTSLIDSDQDGQIDTGSLAPGEEAQINLQLLPPPDAQVGATLELGLSALSSLDGSVQALAQLQAALPAPFVQIYSDSQSGMRLELVDSKRRAATTVQGDFSGSTLTLSGSPVGGFVYAWENNDFSSYFFADIEYTLLDAFGGVRRPVTKLTSNLTAGMHTFDHFPSLTVLPNASIGITWVRKLISASGDVNWNVYLAILASDGELEFGPHNLTNNDRWRSPLELDVPEFITPHIIATQDNRFLLTWSVDWLAATGEASDIYLAEYDNGGEVITAPYRILESVPGQLRYSYPSLVSLSNNRYLLIFLREDLLSATHTLQYLALDGAGMAVGGVFDLANGVVESLDGVQVTSGEIIVAWCSPQDGQVHYAALDGTTYQILGSVQTITNPDGRVAESVSITRDQTGHAVLTWMDGEQRDFLYYALTGAQGNLLTPAMIFVTGQALDPKIDTNQSGEGNAPYLPGKIMLPLLEK